MENKRRLAKRIAESGIASRREAERLIEDGRVCVNNELISSPVFFVDETDVVTVNGMEIQKKQKEILLWKFYKPMGVITAKNDNHGRKTVFDFLNVQDQRLLYIGRLDYNSEGLLLFTNNGDVARKMQLPSTALKRTYRVRIFGDLSVEAIKKLKNGITIDGIKYGRVDIQFESKPQQRSANIWIRVTISEGKNREIRKIMQYFRCTVNRLVRISYGPFDLGDLNPGNFKMIDNKKLKKFLHEYDIS